MEDDAALIQALECSLQMAQAALAIKNQALHTLAEEVYMLRQENLALCCQGQGAGGLLPQLRAARDACAALQADKAQLTAALAEEQGKVEALETELEQTADAALELWESMQYSDMAAAAAATAGGAQLGEDDECDGASSLGGGEPEEAWGSPMAEESLLGQPMTPPSLPAQAAAAQLGFLAPVSPLGLMGPPMSPLAAQSALVVAGDSFGMMTPVEQRLAALSSKLLGMVESWQARMDRLGAPPSVKKVPRTPYFVKPALPDAAAADLSDVRAQRQPDVRSG